EQPVRFHSRPRHLLRLTLAVALAFTGLLPLSLRAADPPSGQNTAIGQTSDKDLVGSWNLSFGPDFSESYIVTFTPGGGMSIQGGLAGTGPAGPFVWSQGQGAWERNDRGQFAFTVFTVLTNPTQRLVTIKDRGVLEMNSTRDGLSGQQFREFILPDKTVV